ncbi:hypothetical protein B0H14DRAFT_3137551 [Mycena olivaceomarginata]|nr:hypothetical protein B0H14DRAFT_3137551 [Mycena olivaceomarginata]
MFLSEEKKKTDPRRKSKREEGSIERGKRGARPKGNRMRTPQLHKDKCAGRRPDKGRRPWCEQGSSSKRGSKRRAGHGGHGGRGALRRSAAGAQVRAAGAQGAQGRRKAGGRADWARKHAPTDAHAVISTIMPREDNGHESAIQGKGHAAVQCRADLHVVVHQRDTEETHLLHQEEPIASWIHRRKGELLDAGSFHVPAPRDTEQSPPKKVVSMRRDLAKGLTIVLRPIHTRQIQPIIVISIAKFATTVPQNALRLHLRK